MILLLDASPATLRKKGELLLVEARDVAPVELPLADCEGVIVTRATRVTYNAMVACGRHGVPVVYLERERPVMLCHPFAAHGLVDTRRAQILAYADRRGVHLGARFVAAAIENKARLLLYYAKNLRPAHPAHAAEIYEGAQRIRATRNLMLARVRERLADDPGVTVDDLRLPLLGHEGDAAREYFARLATLVPDEFGFRKRQRRPPPDPVNSLLSLGYAVLQGVVGISVAVAGLELYAGFVHSDRSGKPSLLLDMIEEFRQPLVDRLVLRLVRRHQITPDDFTRDAGRGGTPRLSDAKRPLFYEEFFATLAAENPAVVARPSGGGAKGSSTATTGPTSASSTSSPTGPTRSRAARGRTSLQRVILRQGRRLARYLLGHDPKYKPYLMKW